MKTKNIIKLLSLSLVLTFAVSCEEDFLDTNPSQFISSDDFGESATLNPALNDAVLNGIYSLMISEDVGGTTSRVDDHGQKGFDLLGDILSCDVAHSTNVWGWYRDFANLQITVDNTQVHNNMAWVYYYSIIRSVNTFIKSSGGNDFVPETPAGKHAMGQAKAIRGYAYFYLAQFFTNEYNQAEVFIPLMLDPEQDLQPQSTNEEVYNQIIEDLTDAIDLLEGFNRSAKSKINQNVARALLAYTYGAIGTMDANTKAFNLTTDILNNTSATIMTNAEVAGGGDPATVTIGGFDKIDTSGWIWGFDLTADMGLGLNSWWAHMDQFVYGYQSAGNLNAIDQALFDQIPMDDARREQFDYDPNSDFYLAAHNKFYAPARTIDGTMQVTMDYVFMRIAEIYLLNAEMAAKTGNEGAARISLKELVNIRVPDASYIDSLSGQDLLDEIYLQTRIELYGEGKSYLAMKRNKATVSRSTNHLFHAGTSYQYNDDALRFEVPISEIQNNPNIN